MNISLGSDIPFVDAGEVVIASDPKAKRTICHIRRNGADNLEVLSRRDGPSGSLYTFREIKEMPFGWRYLAEGDDIEELSQRLNKTQKVEFSDFIEDSIADVVAKHAVAAAKEMGI